MRMKKKLLRISISAALGFLASLAISEVVIRVIDVFSNQPNNGLEILAEAAAYTAIRLFVIGLATPIIALVLYRKLSRK